MRYNAEQLEELGKKVDLVELIGETEELHRKGQYYFTNCPFHDGDRTPSLCINPASNKWHCFGCNTGSSVYDWLMQRFDKKFYEALQIVCERANENIEDYIESESMAYLKQLNRNNKKGIDVNIRKTLNFADDYLNKYSNELPQEWLDEDMTADSLRHYNVMVDHNANRIVYPVFDADNNFIGAKGRTRIKAYKELGLAKYMNYNKIGTIDYFQGWQQALPEINNSKSVIIFEGVKSCIKAYGWGITNTVASETSALSDGQVKLLLKSGVREVIIGWDTDHKFREIVKDSKIQILKQFVTVSVIDDRHPYLDDKMAPVDMGEKVFRQLLKEKIKL